MPSMVVRGVIAARFGVSENEFKRPRSAGGQRDARPGHPMYLDTQSPTGAALSDAPACRVSNERRDEVAWAEEASGESRRGFDG